MNIEPPLLVSAALGSRIIGVSKRTFHSFRKREDFPKPIVLGPRAVRGRRVEIESWVAGLRPKTAKRKEPERLAKARRERARS
jgi:predicted DNA-binding transcriptional regulator AlpA